MSRPTKKDAALWLQMIGIMNADEKLQKALLWINEGFDEKNFKNFIKLNPLGSEGYRNIMSFASYGEIIGVLVNRELLSEDLVFDIAGDMLWEKVGAIVVGLRKHLKKSRLFENYEVFCRRYTRWAEKNPPKIR